MALPPIRRQIVVAAKPEVAFEVFTEEIGQWWPLATHSVFGGDADVVFHDGRLVERDPGGAESVWGSVLDWEPPRGFRITWHPGSDPDQATEVEVAFVPVADGRTLVTLEHRGWERLPDPTATRTEYGNGWPKVLGRYVERFGAAADADEDQVWLALLHTPGPAVGGPLEVFAHPDFAEHLAFLRRLREDGVLVAAGPFPASGEGMTVVKVAPDAVADYVRRAQEDDLSVARGVLQVRARPWQVVLTG
jgi:uncharacterized protein YciI